MDKILVTGGAGFIGSNLIRELVKLDSYEISVIDNFSTGYEENISNFAEKIHFVEGDIQDFNLLNSITKNIDVIFHLAAQVGNLKSIEKPVADAEINFLSSRKLLEAAKSNGVKKIIYSSSAACFGEPEYLPIDEKHPQNPSSPYGVSKLAAEKDFLCYGRILGISCICLRYFNVYGINQRYDAYGNVIPIFVESILQDREIYVYGDGEQTRDFVNVKDVVNANMLTMSDEVTTNVFNIGTGQKVSINQLIFLLKKLFNINFKVIFKDGRKGEVKHSFSNINNAKQFLNYQPEINLENGLNDYIFWYKTFLTHKK